MIRNIFLALGFLCCFVSAFGQQLKKADRLFKELAYVEASEAYEAYLKGNKTPSPEVLENIADSYYFISKDSSAVKYYKNFTNYRKQECPEHISTVMFML